LIVGAGLSVSLEVFVAEAEGIGPTLPGGKLLDLPLCFTSRRGLGVARAGVEDHPPEPPGLGAVAALLGQDGEVAQGEVAVDALVDATELVGSFSQPFQHGFSSSSISSSFHEKLYNN
jgi:hypothetical protein